MMYTDVYSYRIELRFTELNYYTARTLNVTFNPEYTLSSVCTVYYTVHMFTAVWTIFTFYHLSAEREFKESGFWSEETAQNQDWADTICLVQAVQWHSSLCRELVPARSVLSRKFKLKVEISRRPLVSLQTVWGAYTSAMHCRVCTTCTMVLSG